MKAWGGIALCFLVLVTSAIDVRQAEGFTFSLDGLTAPATAVAPDDILSAGIGPPPAIPTPLFLPGAAGLPIGPPPPPPPVDVDAFSYGEFFGGPHSLIGVEFSVAPGCYRFDGNRACR